MRIAELYARPGLTISFEFFPPKSDEAETVLFTGTLPALKRLGPSFVSVTYGAGGSTRDKTLRMVERIRTELALEAMAHVTCVGASRETMTEILDEARRRLIGNILALRGDPPRGQTHFLPAADGFAYAVDLIRFIKERYSFCIGAACYPEGHVECPDKTLDWDRTAAKVEAGAEFLISQLFYDVQDFLTMRSYLHKRGVNVPIVPGILPFLSAEQIRRFAALCGAKLPPSVQAGIERYAHDDESVRLFGIEVCTRLCQELLAAGVPGLHFYCLNRYPSVAQIMYNLGLVADGALLPGHTAYGTG
ncbi:MAG: methylenetetrahydrofolate reductase [NAD(P)H] [Gemmataceae bacterium]